MGKILIAGVLGLSLGLGGCVISVDGDGDGVNSQHRDWQQIERENRQNINALAANMSQAEVLGRMGVPDFSELYEKDQDSYQVLYFRTQRKEGDGVTTKDECTPVMLKNGKLVGWGETAYGMLIQ